jgi:hypothetical protein
MHKVYTAVVGKPERMRHLRTPRQVWENNIKIYLKQIVWEGLWSVELVSSLQDEHYWLALVNTTMNLWVPEEAGNLLTGWVAVISFSRKTLLFGVNLLRNGWTSFALTRLTCALELIDSDLVLRCYIGVSVFPGERWNSLFKRGRTTFAPARNTRRISPPVWAASLDSLRMVRVHN